MLNAADREHWMHLLHEMLRIRRFEEKCAELYSAGKIRGFLHLYIGQEAVAMGASVLATACPFCLLTLEDAAKTAGLSEQIAIKNITELVSEGMEG